MGGGVGELLAAHAVSRRARTARQTREGVRCIFLKRTFSASSLRHPLPHLNNHAHLRQRGMDRIQFQVPSGFQRLCIWSSNPSCSNSFPLRLRPSWINPSSSRHFGTKPNDHASCIVNPGSDLAGFSWEIQGGAIYTFCVGSTKTIACSGATIVVPSPNPTYMENAQRAKPKTTSFIGEPLLWGKFLRFATI